MSASSKKKLRREQAADSQTKKQQAAKKESSRMRLYTIIFFVVIALMIAVVAIAVLDNSGIVDRNVTAVKVGDLPVSAVEFNMYYQEAINSFYNQYGSYANLVGLDLNTPLDQQTSSDGSNSWADYFISEAKDNILNIYSIYNAAVEAGYTLTDELTENVDAIIESLKSTAASTGYDNVEDYLVAMYGTGANLKTYRKVMEIRSISTAYYNDYLENLTYSDDVIQSKDAEDPTANNFYSYNTYIMYTSDYLTGGTKDAEGNVTYSDEEKAASIADAEKDAAALVNGGYTTVEELDEAIAELPVNADSEASSYAVDDTRISSIPSFMRDWITDSSRQPGDITYVERTGTGSDGEQTITGYNVILFRGSSDNNYPLANVRHILVAFEGGTKDSSTGTVTYSDAEKNAAKEEAQAILNEWLSGDATEDSFGKLASERSDDPGSKDNGGLYEDVYPGEMDTNFNEWCFDESRKPGDYGLVETTYGWHVMFYSGDSETTYREYIITEDMRTEDMNNWLASLEEKYPVTDVNLSRVNRGLIINPYSTR